MEEMRRKPDMETESMRVWFEGDKEKELSGKEVDYKSLKFGLLGFDLYTNKKGEVVFAIKVKGDKLFYYCKEDLREGFFKMFKVGIEMMGLELCDINNTFEHIYQQMDVIENWEKVKKK